MTGVLELVDTTASRAGDDDHELFSHYARKIDIERSMFEGVDIVALCGKKWRPSRDFTKYPVCPTCKEILSGIPEE
jgi:hypothetical protein